MPISTEEITRLKGLGFLRNRGTDCFSGRIVPVGTLFTADQLEAVAQLSRQFSGGQVSFTSRQCAELIGIPYEQIDAAMAFAQAHGLAFGGTGAKIRPITACKGTTCVYGLFDTRGLATLLHKTYYLGWSGVKLPHKFKIGVGGCPNSCMKPSLNDLGIEGHRAPALDTALCKGCKSCRVQASCPSRAAHVADGTLVIDSNQCKTCGVCVGKCPFQAIAPDASTVYEVYLGGTWGKSTRAGTALSRTFTAEDLPDMVDKVLLWFRENAYIKERLGQAIDRTGVDLNAVLSGNDLILRKEEILSAPLKSRP